MKYGILIVLIWLVSVGGNAPVLLDESPNMTTLKFELSAIPDHKSGIVECLPTDFLNVQFTKTGTISGMVSELGVVDGIESTYEVGLCHYGPGSNEITVMFNGKVVGANGDFITFYSNRIVNQRNGTFTGEMNFVSGSGAFYGITGTIETEGQLDRKKGITTWRGEGRVTLPPVF